MQMKNYSTWNKKIILLKHSCPNLFNSLYINTSEKQGQEWGFELNIQFGASFLSETLPRHFEGRCSSRVWPMARTAASRAPV